MMEQLETGNIGIGNTSPLATLNNDRFIIVDQKEIFWTGASLKDAGRLTFAAAKMGEEIIPGLLDPQGDAQDKGLFKVPYWYLKREARRVCYHKL